MAYIHQDVRNKNVAVHYILKPRTSTFFDYNIYGEKCPHTLSIIESIPSLRANVFTDEMDWFHVTFRSKGEHENRGK